MARGPHQLAIPHAAIALIVAAVTTICVGCPTTPHPDPELNLAVTGNFTGPVGGNLDIQVTTTIPNLPSDFDYDNNTRQHIGIKIEPPHGVELLGEESDIDAIKGVREMIA